MQVQEIELDGSEYRPQAALNLGCCAQSLDEQEDRQSDQRNDQNDSLDRKLLLAGTLLIFGHGSSRTSAETNPRAHVQVPS